MRPTYHLVPEAEWQLAADEDRYVPASIAAEGFVHCTDGETELLRTADRYYRDDRRPFVVLTIDLDRVAAAWTIDDPAGIYPHIHGPVERTAIVAIASLVRDAHGRFLSIAQGSLLG